MIPEYEFDGVFLKVNGHPMLCSLNSKRNECGVFCPCFEVTRDSSPDHHLYVVLNCCKRDIKI